MKTFCSQIMTIYTLLWQGRVVAMKVTLIPFHNCHGGTPRSWWQCGRHQPCREYLHLLRTVYTSGLYPVTHLLSLCPLGNFPRWPEVSSAARMSVGLSGQTCFAQSLYLETPGLGRKLNSLALQTRTMGLQSLSIPVSHVQWKAGKKGH